MKTPAKLLALSLITATLAACSDDNNGNNTDPQNDPGTTANSDAGSDTDGSATTGDNTDGSATDSGTDGTGTTDGTATDSGTDGTGTTDGASTDAGTDGTATDTGTDGTGTTDSSATDAGTDGTATDSGTDGTGTDGNSTDSGTDGTGTTDGSSTDAGTDGSTDGSSTPPGLSDGEVPPELPDPFADAIPGPSSSDPFGSLLEADDESATGGIPTAPKNLRVDLVSNDWAEINWAPSNDDGEVVEYNIYRSDGHVYTVGRDQTDPVGGTQAEIDKIWQTTSFIDCNYTRFLDRLHVCADNGPTPGNTYSYQVTAVDDEGNESLRSNSVTITYHLEQNAPIPRYEDFYLDPSDDFAQRNNFTQSEWFLDEFDLMFADEFDGDSIDSSKWNTELVWADNRIINGEQQYFVDALNDTEFGYDPFRFTGSSLVIESVPVPDDLRQNLPPVCDEEDPFGVDRCEFLSGALSSHDKYGFIYGYVEGRMKVSSGAGALSSFYLYHRYPGEGVLRHAPEIDIVEYLGENPFGDEDAFQTHHFADVTYDTIRSAPTMNFKNPDGSLYSDGYHTYGVLWEPQLVIWYIDGVEIKRMTGPMVGRQPMNIVTYLVAGSGWAPTPDVNDPDLFPLQYEIDYIRVYQRDAYQGTSSYGN
ncbi:MAG: family 16 glycosylhydrolase [Gammaproteobacteria bacterium]|nr:family 16 glycosylhydrolase [Gammaproteobacteria bacterium]